MHYWIHLNIHKKLPDNSCDYTMAQLKKRLDPYYINWEEMNMFGTHMNVQAVEVTSQSVFDSLVWQYENSRTEFENSVLEYELAQLESIRKI